MSAERVQEAAESLFQAERMGVPIEPLTLHWDNLTHTEAQQIQLANIKKRTRAGQRIVGYKLGLTSREAQRQFQVFEPDFGHLLNTMEAKTEIDAKKLIQPRIEGEIAFVMGQELYGEGVDLKQVEGAIDCAVLAMEIVDCRYTSWKVKGLDFVADNGASARFVLGSVRKKLSEVDLAHVGMAFSRNGEIEVTGAGAAVMGNPLNAVVFLVKKLAGMGRGVRPGEVILCGSLGAMLPAKAGDSFTCEMLGLGQATVRFSEGVGQ